MNLKFLKLLSGLVVALCLVTIVSAGTGIADGTDSIVGSTPEVMPVTDMYGAPEEATENITEKSPAVTDEVNLIPIEDDSAKYDVTEEEMREELSLLSETEPETTEIVIEESDFNWDGRAVLVKGHNFKYSPTNDPTAEYDVNATSDLAALEIVAEENSFEFYTSDSGYEKYRTFSLTGISDVNNTADWSYYWAIYVNGVSAPMGFSGNILEDGDLLQFCYGYSNYTAGIFPSPTSFTNIVNITVDVHENFNYEGEVSLTRSPDFKYSPTDDPTAEYDVNATSDLAALKAAGENGGFNFYTSDSGYETYKTFSLNGIGDLNNEADWSYYWSIYINGESAPMGLSGNILEDGDLLQFCYGYSDYTEGIFPTPTTFDSIVNLTVSVHDDFNWEGEIILKKGPDFNFSATTNPSEVYIVNATSDLAALKAAAEKGAFEFYTDDSWYETYGSFTLTGIDDVNNTAKWGYYWAIFINGEAADMGLSGNILNDGDLLQFCYGYSSWTEGIFPSPSSFTNIVNITVDVEDYSSMAMLIPSKTLMEDTPYTTQISVANITDASGLSTFLTWNPDVIDILNVTANSSVFSGSAIYLNLTDGYAEVALTNTDGLTTGTPAPVFDVYFRSKKGLHQETILLGTGTQYSDKSFINHTLPCEDGIFRIERVKGDFNGNGFVDIGDVSRVAYMVADKTLVDMEADFNENGRIDVGDAAAIAWYLIGKTGVI
ncbi:DUF4430 domain-containing protein [Methanoplanus limicola]|uniref:Transcobalamin-like C-terminal domain-containing protein n=1 Tax=Methanoplanus limicola DSM 2279 TaxID=937775 RepID=H1Z045_9EURY|nr:DUF4430 domain-containing protein [Methanoplanus limicola]EHQ36137.1 hypothetical protein Metlim_2052 [Methanoplanus limicola DSM 2279]